MWLFFAFGAVSILWSDYPFVSFKRWNKAIGNVIMVLIILTEQRPYEAIGIILRRFAYILIPLSVLFSKYYPHLGRAYHRNIQMFTGVTDHKNALGQICLVSGIYFSWMLLLKCRDNDEMGPLDYSIYIMILLMTAWLLYMANSATSLASMVVAVGLFVVGRHSLVAREPHKILAIGIASIIFFGVLEISFGFSETVIALFGREPDLTDRVPMWRNLLAMVKNPMTGFGFESFWLGNRRLIIKELWGPFVQAHNGYLQVYLDLGLIGLFLLVGWILSGFKKVANFLSANYSVGMLRLCFILVVVLYNWTEATFYGVNLLWSVLLLGVMDIPSLEEETI
jgi:O-antigen ligase